jgi:hypothetical protein
LPKALALFYHHLVVQSGSHITELRRVEPRDSLLPLLLRRLHLLLQADYHLQHVVHPLFQRLHLLAFALLQLPDLLFQKLVLAPQHRVLGLQLVLPLRNPSHLIVEAGTARGRRVMDPPDGGLFGNAETVGPDDLTRAVTEGVGGLPAAAGVAAGGQDIFKARV